MAVVIAGTGTDVGKTLLCAAIMARYAKEKNLLYLKPVQTGGECDREQVAALAGLDNDHFLPEFARYLLAASPHYAAEMQGQSIDFAALLAYILRAMEKRSLVIELAGGLMVPLTRYRTQLELLQQLKLPVLLAARTELGTINHTLLSLQALQAAQVHCAGVFFVGAENPLFADNCRSIHEMSGVPILGNLFLPQAPLTSANFTAALRNFDSEGKIRQLL